MNDNFELPKLADNDNQVVNEVKEEYDKSFKGMFKYITTRDTKDLFMVLVRLLIIAGIIVVFHLPISFIKELGVNILTLLNIKISDMILNVWYFICEGLYFIVAIIAFIKIVKTRYANLTNK